ncbi:hypothetical protein BDP55DRAFT_635392 [Colletotrichum godetiae]|uniref:Uncharacterized protein n=1 Tax=Colletotrichum godetiae TaxID=1209918 RepID=A0AAJ0AES4_9PEZI|nr:uncharacterized protein BDP55DRAFT_635392 [Colletotrichum godetiae]KAK1671975.1 hypothetical protein BDP55DRAFT_635392 [Colletotrichum godetiae]
MHLNRDLSVVPSNTLYLGYRVQVPGRSRGVDLELLLRLCIPSKCAIPLVAGRELALTELRSNPRPWAVGEVDAESAAVLTYRPATSESRDNLGHTRPGIGIPTTSPHIFPPLGLSIVEAARYWAHVRPNHQGQPPAEAQGEAAVCGSAYSVDSGYVGKKQGSSHRDTNLQQNSYVYIFRERKGKKGENTVPACDNWKDAPQPPKPPPTTMEATLTLFHKLIACANMAVPLQSQRHFSDFGPLTSRQSWMTGNHPHKHRIQDELLLLLSGISRVPVVELRRRMVKDEQQDPIHLYTLKHPSRQSHRLHYPGLEKHTHTHRNQGLAMPSRPILPHAVAVAVARMNIPHKLYQNHMLPMLPHLLATHPYGNNPQATHAQRPTYSYWSPGTAAQHVNPVTFA